MAGGGIPDQSRFDQGEMRERLTSPSTSVGVG